MQSRLALTRQLALLTLAVARLARLARQLKPQALPPCKADTNLRTSNLRNFSQAKPPNEGQSKFYRMRTAHWQEPVSQPAQQQSEKVLLVIN